MVFKKKAVRRGTEKTRTEDGKDTDTNGHDQQQSKVRKIEYSLSRRAICVLEIKIRNL